MELNIILFPRAHGNQFRNLVGSLRGPDFPISAHGHGNASGGFCPLVYKVFFQEKKIDLRVRKNKKYHTLFAGLGSVRIVKKL